MTLIEWLTKLRNELLQKVKQNKSDDYRSGYVDGALDMFNEARHIISPVLAATEIEEKK